MPDNPDRYCAAPFVHICYTVDGKTQPCCTWTGLAYEKNTNPFDHRGIRDLREAFLANKPHWGCSSCYNMERLGNRSFRMGLIQSYGRPESPALRYLEFNLGNLCNMKCRMCDSRNSSKWAADEIALGKVPQPLRRWNLDNIDVDLSTIDRIKFKGGEPCLEQDAIISILNRVSSCKGGLGDVTIDVTTNGSKVFNDELMRLLSGCKLVQLNISIDGIGDVNDYQRTGSNWSDISENLRSYHRSCGENFVLQTTTTWTLLNANGSIEFMSWVHENLPRFSVYGDPVETPSYLCVSNIGQDMKVRILDRLNRWDGLDHIGWVMHNKRVLIDELSNPMKVDSATVLEMITALDRLRGEDFSKIEPDIYMSLVNRG